VPERAASMLNPKLDEVDDEEVENLGGSTRVNGEPVLRRLRIPIRFRVGERPAGADRGVDFEASVLSLGAGERAGRIGRRGEVMGLQEVKSLGEGGARVRKKFVGLRGAEVPSGFLERLGERKMMGSMFSASLVSASKAEALRLLGEVREEIARGENVRFMIDQ